MAWKQLAFSDEVMTNPATADLDMAGNNITNTSAIIAQGDDGQVYLVGGSGTFNAQVNAYGKTRVAEAGNIIMYVPNVAASANLVAAYADGLSDAPKFGIGYGLEMNQKEIEAMVFENLATAPHSGTEVQGEVYYDTADDHLHVWVV